MMVLYFKRISLLYFMIFMLRINVILNIIKFLIINSFNYYIIMLKYLIYLHNHINNQHLFLTIKKIIKVFVIHWKIIHIIKHFIIILYLFILPSLSLIVKHCHLKKLLIFYYLLVNKKMKIFI